MSYLGAREKTMTSNVEIERLYPTLLFRSSVDTRSFRAENEMIYSPP